MAELLFDIIVDCPKDEIIGDNLIRAYKIINDSKYKKIICTISGGADSDIILDICVKCDVSKKIEYVWFNTGLEYKATKEHLKYLEEKYNIKIREEKAIKSIPRCCKEYGQPFLSKQISEWIERLQQHDFKWEDEPYEVLLKRYCKWSEKRQEWRGCRSALQWWCNEKGEKSRFNISNNRWLKEFMLANPPEIPISNKCCKFAKKDILHSLVSAEKYDLSITGLRKYEGGARATAYKNCFSEEENGCDNYRPVWYYLNGTKSIYEKHYGVIHSCAYSQYGLKRTGCAGCPFGQDFEFELEVIKKYEPTLFKAVNHIFRDSYSYTRKYREFCAQMNSNK